MKDYLKQKIRDQLLHKDISLFKEDLDEKRLYSFVSEAMEEIIRKERVSFSVEEKQKILEELVDELVGLGPLKPLLADPKITEIMINGPKQVYIEEEGKIKLSKTKFKDKAQLFSVIERLISGTGRRVDESCPYVDFSLPDGSRVNIVLPPISLIGPVITIRKFSPEISKIEDLVRLGTLDRRMAEFLVLAIKAKLNILFSGATGAGKTTTLNVLSSYIPSQERIITIEDTAELRLHQEHLVRLETRPPNIEGRGGIGIRELFKNSLHMRPDRIILGEIRGQEALEMVQAITSGHQGSLAVIHASSPQDALSRLEMMILTSGISLPLWMIRRQITEALDLIIHIEHFVDGKRRITHISEIRELKNDEIELANIFYFQQDEITKDGRIIGRWRSSGIRPLFLKKFQKRGLSIKEEIFHKD